MLRIFALLLAVGWASAARAGTFVSDNFNDTAGTTLQAHTPSGGGTWVETDDFSCLMYATVSPLGDIQYDYQRENLAMSRTGNLYVYDADDVAAVADGTMDHFDIRATFYRWNSSTNGGITGLPRALCYDANSGYLWVYHERNWTSGLEKYPVVAAYSLSVE